jgi:pyridoxamine 5'-phosphate oxidase
MNDSFPSVSMSNQRDLHALRVDYSKHELLESDTAGDPVEQFARWFEDARQCGAREPNAMTLATVGADGAPSARVVLMKDLDSRGLTFFTNYQSRKGRELEQNPKAAAVFFWEPLERQVRIEGPVQKVSREESAAYFAMRPREARIGAWASAQSRVIASRDELDRRARELNDQFPGDVPLPDAWGGYRLTPTVIEFWQGRPSRLHDRIRYTKTASGWTIERLSP